MIERDSCYFCTSPFQFFPILSLAVERKETADLYIDPQFSEAEQFAERIRKTGIFHEVKVINSDKIYGKYIRSRPGIKNHIQIANSYLHVKDIAELILFPGVKYNHIFVSSKAYIPRMVQLYYIKQKWDFYLYYFEDGTATYCYNKAYQIKKWDELIRRFLFGEKSVDMGCKCFVFAPDIYRILNEKRSIKIGGLRRFWEEKTGKDIVNCIFNVSEKIAVNEKLIILDQPKEEFLNTADIKSVNNLYHSLIENIGVNNAVIKKHPRSREKEIDQVNYFRETGVPFEVYCMNMNMDEKIIVSYASTAVATPKVLFGQEPKVIVLTRLFRPKTGEENLFEDYFLAVKNSYANPEKFCIPENLEELKDIISTL